MNLWSSDYVETASPVTDLSMEVKGEAARDAQLFLNELWAYVQAYGQTTVRPVDITLTRTPTYVVSSGLVDQSYVKPIPAPEISGSDSAEVVPILAVGRGGYLRNGRLTRLTAKTLSPQDKQFSTGWLWNLVGDGGVMNDGDPQWDANNPGETALRSLVSNANREIVMTQQMLEFKFFPIGKPVFDYRLYKALADRIVAGAKVDIITYNLNVDGDYKANNPQHSWCSLAALVYRSLQSTSAGLNLDHSGLVDLARSLMSKSLSIKGLSIKGLRVSSLPGWPGQSVSPGLHSKVVSVDDSAFYMGSQNAYPNKLLEYGYIVENQKAASDLNRIYLDPANFYSKAFAVNTQASFVDLLPKKDVYVGNSGGDVFNGADGDDAISGGDGEDRLRGGLGRDVITGGGGADVFVYRGLAESRPKSNCRDLVVDFDPLIDKVDLTSIDANSVLNGVQAPVWQGELPFSGQPGELTCLQQGNNLIVRLDVNGDKKCDFEIALGNQTYSAALEGSILGLVSA